MFMETLTLTKLEEAIQKRAEKKLYKDLYDCARKEDEISGLLSNLYQPQLDLGLSNGRYALRNELTKNVFDKMLPKYIQEEVDQLMAMIDQWKDVINNQNT